MYDNIESVFYHFGGPLKGAHFSSTIEGTEMAFALTKQFITWH